MKNPASGRHFTGTFRGNRVRKSSQCSSVARPPEEQPVSKAYRPEHKRNDDTVVEFV
jgi:hypothetical protein